MRLLLLFSLSFLLISCGYVKKPDFIQNRNTEYLKARSVPPLRIPPGVSTGDFSAKYPVSDRYYPESAKNVSIAPPGL